MSPEERLAELDIELPDGLAVEVEATVALNG